MLEMISAVLLTLVKIVMDMVEQVPFSPAEFDPMLIVGAAVSTWLLVYVARVISWKTA